MELYDLLHRVVSALEQGGIPYLITGSVASMAYGEPRMTRDIDLVAEIEDGHVEGLLRSFPEPEFYLSDFALREAIELKGMVNILQNTTGLKVDVMIRSDSEFDKSRFSRKRRVQPGDGVDADFAAPEDVILKKLEYFREGGSEKHMRDVTGILRVSGEDLDRRYIDTWVGKLALSHEWEDVLHRFSQEGSETPQDS